MPPAVGGMLGEALRPIERHALAALGGGGFGWDLEGAPFDERVLRSARQFARLAGEAARHAVEDPFPLPANTAYAALIAAAGPFMRRP